MFFIAPIAILLFAALLGVSQTPVGNEALCSVGAPYPLCKVVSLPKHDPCDPRLEGGSRDPSFVDCPVTPSTVPSEVSRHDYTFRE